MKTKDNIPTEQNSTFTRIAGRISVFAAALFIILLTTLHFIEPEFEPTKHLISEYELGRFGWMMSLAFFSWGISVLALVLATWSSITNVRGLIGRWWFLIIFVAFIGAGIFYPYTTPNTASLIHSICGTVVIFTFPIAALLYRSGLLHSKEWNASRGRLNWALILVWVGFLTFFVSLILFPPIRNNGNVSLIVGWQNRFMVLTYGLWIILVSSQVAFAKVNRK